MSQKCTATTPITLMAYPGSHPIFKAGTTSGYPRFWIGGEWWIIDGFEITNNYDGIKIEEGSHITIRNNWLHANYGQGLDIARDYCDTAKTGKASTPDGGDILVYNNTIELNSRPDNGFSPPCSSTYHCDGIHGIYVSAGGLSGYCTGKKLMNVTIRNNVIRKNGGGIHVNINNGSCNGSDFPYFTNSLIENNILADNPLSDIIFFYNTQNINVRNNTLIQNAYPTTDATGGSLDIVSFWGSSTHNNTFTNNIFYSTRTSDTYSLFNVKGGAETFNNNLWYQKSNLWYWNGTYRNDFGSAYLSTTGWDTNGQCCNIDPKFVAVGSNYTLQSTSPALNKGTNAQCALKDYIGTMRPQESICDI